jgi:hypothetical protein
MPERIGGRFVRSAPQAREYVSGLVAGLGWKNGWTLAEQAGEMPPDGMQRLLRWADWDIDAVRDDLRDDVIEHLASTCGCGWKAATPRMCRPPRSTTSGGRHWWSRTIRIGWQAGRGHWLLARRSITDPAEIACYVCYGPRHSTPLGLAWLAVSRSVAIKGESWSPSQA